MPRREMMSDEKDSAGWISMADVLMLSTILLIATSYGTAQYANGQQRIARERGKRLSLLEAAEQRIVVLEKEKKELERKQEELAARKDELEKAIRDLDREIANLTAVVSDQGTAIADLKKVEAQVKQLESDRLALQAKMDDLQRLMEQVNARLDAKQKELASAQSRMASLQKQLDAARVAESTLKKERDAERASAAKIRSELDRAKEATAALEKERDAFKQQVAAAKTVEQTLKTAVETQTASATHFKELLQQQNDRIIKPLETAGVVVRARTESLRGDLDLDIYVQDPDDKICFWKEPRVLTKYAERATLIPSEDLRFASLLDEQASPSVTEETYYASIPLEGSPYLVFCMIRHTSEVSQYESIAQKVTWEITIKNAHGQTRILTGERVIIKTGALEVKEVNDDVSEIHQGLFPLTGFQIVDPASPHARQLNESELPAQPRGWRSATGRGRPYVRLRDG